MPLLFLLFATVEMGLIFVANICLSNATLNLARQIRVGRVVASGVGATSSSGSQLDLADFKTAVCSKMLLVPTATCMTQLQLDVRTQSSFQGVSAPNPMATSNFTTAGFCFYSGTPGSVVTMRAYYLWPIQTAFLFPALRDASSVTIGTQTFYGNYYVLTSLEIFKNEPNTSATNTGGGC